MLSSFVKRVSIKFGKFIYVCISVKDKCTGLKTSVFQYHVLWFRVNAEQDDLSGVQLYPVEMVTVEESFK